MFTLYFDDGDKQEVLCKKDDLEDVRKYMYWYIKEILKFKSYYSRMWETKEGTVVDYGSHTNFFIIKKDDM